MSKITIIGAGSWGCALANILCDNQHDILMYDYSENTVFDINNFHLNKKIPNAVLNNKIKATTDICEAIDFSDYIVLSIPTKVIRSVLVDISKVINNEKLFINTSKGLEPDTFKRISEIVKEIIPSNFLRGFVALTGPSHAEEVIVKLPTTICSVCEDKSLAIEVQHLFSNHTYFRVYTGSDLKGSELCAAIKNVYAIASGMLEGLGFGDNARAGLISRALVEMRRIVIKLGANEDTVFGLTGVGDLIVTTTSHHSRNYQAGVKLASGKSLEETISSMDMVVEGARTALAVNELVDKLKIEAPIIKAVYNVIYLKKPVNDVVSELMMRSYKEE